MCFNISPGRASGKRPAIKSVKAKQNLLVRVLLNTFASQVLTYIIF
jgi:hypothetical protein